MSEHKNERLIDSLSASTQKILRDEIRQEFLQKAAAAEPGNETHAVKKATETELDEIMKSLT